MNDNLTSGHFAALRETDFRAKVVNLTANTTPEKRKIHRAKDSRRRVSDFEEVLKSGHRVTACNEGHL